MSISPIGSPSSALRTAPPTTRASSPSRSSTCEQPRQRRLRAATRRLSSRARGSLTAPLPRNELAVLDMRRHVGRARRRAGEMRQDRRSCRSSGPARTMPSVGQHLRRPGRQRQQRRLGRHQIDARRATNGARNSASSVRTGRIIRRRSVRTGCAGYPPSRPRCSARRTAWRNTAARCPSSRGLRRWWLPGVIRNASGTSKASATSPGLSVSAIVRDRRAPPAAGCGSPRTSDRDRDSRSAR